MKLVRTSRPLEVAGRKKGPLRMLLFGTHCQKLCASAKGTSEFGGYASVRGFPDDSEFLMCEDSESTGSYWEYAPPCCRWSFEEVSRETVP